MVVYDRNESPEEAESGRSWFLDQKQNCLRKKNRILIYFFPYAMVKL